VRFRCAKQDPNEKSHAKISSRVIRIRRTPGKLINMKANREDPQSYKIVDCHRNQTFVGLFRRDANTYCWTWKGYIDFDDGSNYSFASQRNFTSKVEAEEYMRRFACARIDNRLDLA
jgi:hypothetical protein